MNNEQEIVRSVFDAYIRDAKATSTKKDRPTFDMLEEVKNRAIKALEQQPSDDCVSRTDLLKIYEDRFFELQKAHQISKQMGVNWCINTLLDMPPVTPAHCIAAVRFSKNDLREICNERIEIECMHGTCKDCKAWDKEEHFCYMLGFDTGKKWYCADFEKRGNEE